MIAIRAGALAVVTPPGGGISFTTDQLDQAKAYGEAVNARALTGMDHHTDLADKVGELIAAAGQAERRANP